MTDSSALVHLDALGPNGPYRAQAKEVITDVTGRPVAELSMVPRLYVRRSLAALRRAQTQPLDERIPALAEAGRLFATATLNGLSVEQYEHAVARVSGLPISVVREVTSTTATGLAGAYGSAGQARPRGSRDAAHGASAARWMRRGDVFAVLTAGNHPGIHVQWAEALALGYRVAVRPSRREPLSAHRLVTALHEAGFGTDRVILLPTDHSVADELVAGADLAMVYGGDAVLNKYRASNTVLPHGPGRAKILITADTDFTRHLDTIVDSISQQAGAGCVNTTAVFVEGDPGPVAAAVAERLAGLPSLPPQSSRAVLPVWQLDAARNLEKFVHSQAAGVTAWLGGETIVAELDEPDRGAAVLRPAVFQLDRADAPQARLELPFPCVWIAPWSRTDGVAPLRNTMVLTALTSDHDLVGHLLDEPTIRNLHVGDHPTHVLVPGLPHDGYLGEFLMRSKTFTNGASATP
ncbi:aldehyde dehydrogenase family protein [Streptomyces zagrosensis]|uniref:Acyl-CoA reductase-like NAD-dependent aldehyde dehydrogenase n=1 Tax=Streptomyces zagrosensis TaxID=1042984 RepID=A0A7W9V236_9ACTN|nr:aldehyde dehydrogenase family protein [Streptomyces zagrosensis]MBB5939840.1 acyl-CoA reductase-like NAD-dependent aldehyde dehydrogenase [Streptomyces zagrosensis]